MSDRVSEDILERYAMKKLTEAEVASIEEHPLVCHLCQDRLAGIDRFLADIRSALAPPQ